MDATAGFLRLTPVEMDGRQIGGTELVNTGTVTHILADQLGTEIHSLTNYSHYVAESLDEVGGMLVEMGASSRFLAPPS